jgi:hypothetical protein
MRLPITTSLTLLLPLFAIAAPFQANLLVDEHARLHARYPTVAGCYYTLEESQDLQTWLPVEGMAAYGDGWSSNFFIKQLPEVAPPPLSSGGGGQQHLVEPQRETS